MLMLDPNERSMSMGRSVSVQVGEGGEEDGRRDRSPSVRGEESMLGAVNGQMGKASKGRELVRVWQLSCQPSSGGV